MMERGFKNLEQSRRYILLVTCGGMAVALVSVAVNLGAVEISRITYQKIDVVFRNMLFLRLFLTAVSVGSAVAILYYRVMESRSFLTFEYLAQKYRYKDALIIADFSKWYEKKKDYIILDWVTWTVAVLIFCLLVVLPVGTFAYSIYQS